LSAARDGISTASAIVRRLRRVAEVGHRQLRKSNFAPLFGHQALFVLLIVSS
jgi:hypothetical protein